MSLVVWYILLRTASDVVGCSGGRCYLEIEIVRTVLGFMGSPLYIYHFTLLSVMGQAQLSLLIYRPTLV
jgi:hypothetical protein